MDKSDVCIVIPIYKNSLTHFEIVSVFQCLKVLDQYTIFFICSENLDLAFYKENFSQIDGFFFFDAKYFKGLEGYNQLMLSALFYEAFKEFKYMLVYQTDCYVFKDELFEWVQKNYDYIGGIWFEGFHGNPEEGARLWYPGNGGFSLRNIKKMRQILNSKTPLNNWKQIVSEKRNLNNGELLKNWKDFIVLCLNFFGYQNNSSYYAKKWFQNEDGFFLEMSSVYNKLKVPEVKDALLFSWDRRPDYLFKKCNQLPFGCHAWFRDDLPYNENKDFWFSFIKM